MIFVHDCDGGIYYIHDSALRRRVYREGERVSYQKEQDRIASKAEQLLDAKLKDVPKMAQRLVLLLFQQRDGCAEVNEGENPKSGHIPPQG